MACMRFREHGKALIRMEAPKAKRELLLSNTQVSQNNASSFRDTRIPVWELCLSILSRRSYETDVAYVNRRRACTVPGLQPEQGQQRPAERTGTGQRVRSKCQPQRHGPIQQYA